MFPTQRTYFSVAPQQPQQLLYAVPSLPVATQQPQQLLFAPAPVMMPPAPAPAPAPAPRSQSGEPPAQRRRMSEEEIVKLTFEFGEEMGIIFHLKQKKKWSDFLRELQDAINEDDDSLLCDFYIGNPDDYSEEKAFKPAETKVKKLFLFY